MTRSVPLGFVLVVALATFSSPASAIPLQATLDGGQEVPGTPSLALGVAQLDYDPGTATLSIEAAVLGIELADGILGFHIHVAPTGTNGAIIVSLGVADWMDIPVVDGMAFMASFDLNTTGVLDPFGAFGGVCTDTATCLAFFESQLFSGDTYLNLHTTAFPSGEIRGQINLPEPGTTLLLLLGLFGLARPRDRHAA